MPRTNYIDLLQLIQRDTNLKRAASTNGGEYAGACPFCGGTDRFRVWPNQDTPRYWCRQCNAQGDAINYLQQRDNLSFHEACEELSIHTDNTYTSHTHRPKDAMNIDYTDCPAFKEPEWQTCATVFIRCTKEILHQTIGIDARNYLLARGITLNTMHSANLGYNPFDRREEWGSLPVWLPQGIVIPWQISNRFERINIRRPSGTPKYINAKGSANTLYQHDRISFQKRVIMVEGEFDVLLLGSYIDTSQYCVVATGSTAGGRFLEFATRLYQTQQVILAFDNDEAGEKASQWWQSKLPQNTIRLRPTHKDITDMFLAGENLADWLAQSETYSQAS